ncbi:MAG: hypothetical protein EA393_15045 [Bacteroidetes bacterium]|nr:MAG: hypothetical protein EA393_15045 [Bacteroidota bacterium]
MFLMPFIIGLQRLRDPSFRCAPVRMTGVDRRIKEKGKKGAAAPLPFFPPHPYRPCHPERSEGSRGHTARQKSTLKQPLRHEGFFLSPARTPNPPVIVGTGSPGGISNVQANCCGFQTPPFRGPGGIVSFSSKVILSQNRKDAVLKSTGCFSG